MIEYILLGLIIISSATISVFLAWAVSLAKKTEDRNDV
jgi:hypothetical protein